MKFVLRLDVTCAQSAMSPRSPVRTRIASSTGNHEDLAVADIARARRLDDGVDSALDGIVPHDHFDLHLGQHVNDHGLAATTLVDDAALGPPAGDVDDVQTVDVLLLQGALHFVEAFRTG